VGLEGDDFLLVQFGGNVLLGAVALPNVADGLHSAPVLVPGDHLPENTSIFINGRNSLSIVLTHGRLN
jgi:hypothetical protein